MANPVNVYEFLPLSTELATATSHIRTTHLGIRFSWCLDALFITCDFKNWPKTETRETEPCWANDYGIMETGMNANKVSESMRIIRKLAENVFS